jgi:hypothetical protein
LCLIAAAAAPEVLATQASFALLLQLPAVLLLLLLTQCAISAPTTEHIQMTSVAKAGLPGRNALPIANTSTAKAAAKA